MIEEKLLKAFQECFHYLSDIEVLQLDSFDYSNEVHLIHVLISKDSTKTLQYLGNDIDLTNAINSKHYYFCRCTMHDLDILFPLCTEKHSKQSYKRIFTKDSLLQYLLSNEVESSVSPLKLLAGNNESTRKLIYV